MTTPLTAGAAQVDVSPRNSQHLFGYPHVERMSTGIHDPLWSSSLFLDDGRTQLIFIANDVIYVSRETVIRIRRRIGKNTGVPPQNIMVSATHTHSGPPTVNWAGSVGDASVARVDPRYLQLLENGMLESAVQACKRAVPAEVGLTVAECTGIGTNRSDPHGPADKEVPVFMVREAASEKPLAGMLVCSMHPTVLHEDSRLVSGDFPGLARIMLQQDLLGTETPVIYHTGPCGNQSPRHVAQANSFREAERLGRILSASAVEAAAGIEFRHSITLSSRQALVDLPRKKLPTIAEARNKLKSAQENLSRLKRSRAPRADVRTAECDLFGAEEIVVLSQSALDGSLEPYYSSCLPAEIQVLRIGSWSFIGWPGEIFVEYGLGIKHRFNNTFIISMANGELQGYIVTEEADREGGYEASNSLFGPAGGRLMVEKTKEILMSFVTENTP